MSSGPATRRRPLDGASWIWRYHPETKRHEIFARAVAMRSGWSSTARAASTPATTAADTRGFHYVQGGYYQKGFSKHGSLSTPNAFGYFPA